MKCGTSKSIIQSRKIIPVKSGALSRGGNNQ